MSEHVDRNTRVPFASSTALNHDTLNDHESTLPGYPRLRLSENRTAILKFLERDLVSHDLERIAPRLWWMSKQDSANISPLHRQRVKSRDIVVTEDPKLHLVWINNRIFLKPLPEYLLNYDFWAEYLSPCPNPRLTNTQPGAPLIRQDSTRVNSFPRTAESAQAELIRASALGYIRTYFYLIKHQSDFRIAKEPALCLVPPDITWNTFSRFSALFDKTIPDCVVSRRYCYGEIRLTRLNFYARFLLGRSHFVRIGPPAQYAAYFARFYAPLLFLFGFMSVVLSAMQVEIAVESLEAGLSPWWAFHRVSRGFSVFALLGTAVVLMGVAGVWLWKFGKEWKFALLDRYIRRRDMHEAMQERDVGRTRAGTVEESRGDVRKEEMEVTGKGIV